MNKEIATGLLEALGGKDNIRALEHCATRLRVVVKDDSKVEAGKIKKTPKVAGYFLQSGQHQVILGTGLVNSIYTEMNKLVDKTLEDTKGAAYENMSPFQKVFEHSQMYSFH